MFRKTSRRYGNEPRKTNAIVWSRKRGGAGSIACAVVVVALLFCVTFTVAASTSNRPSVPIGELKPPVYELEPEPWTPPQKQVEEYNAGFPTRIPI
ncbi:MAG: hypothetical protein R6W91_03405 [Thermoplasmata archaeon]